MAEEPEGVGVSPVLPGQNRHNTLCDTHIDQHIPKAQIQKFALPLRQFCDLCFFRTVRKIKDLDFPHDAIIGGIVRGDKTFIAVGNMEINAYDRVVVFAMPGSVGKVGYYFN